MGNCQSETPGDPNRARYRGPVTYDSERGAVTRLDPADMTGAPVSTASPELELDLARIQEQYRGTYERVNATERVWQQRMTTGFELHDLRSCYQVGQFLGNFNANFMNDSRLYIYYELIMEYSDICSIRIQYLVSNIQYLTPVVRQGRLRRSLQS